MLRSLMLLCAAFALAQTPPPPVTSPEVHPDGSVTFRFRDPNAQAVTVALEGRPEPIPMQKDSEGVWSATTPPLDPELYGYSFRADGASLIDPSNQLMKPNLLSTQSMVHVPGPPTLPWERTDIAHGTVDHRFYHSQTVGDDRDFYVYTPPGYDGRQSARYPVLYLLHGFSDDASGWTSVGRANLILDHLIDAGTAKPMIVVMTLGYGAPEVLHLGFSPGTDPAKRQEMMKRNVTRYRDALFGEVIPAFEKEYRVYTDRDHRAIAGLSMGGAESLFTGLNALDRFGWIGSFSGGGLTPDNAANFPNLTSDATAHLHLLWIACGTEDRLIEPNRKLRAWLTEKGIRHTDIETPGMHTWMVWRANLAAFAPLLFQPGAH